MSDGDEMMPVVVPPWSSDQVAALNAFQRSGRFHPFTCGQRASHVGDDILVATGGGWVCPHEGCGYTQKWAHPLMTERLPDRRWPWG